MSVFLCLCNTKLAFSCPCNGLTEGVAYILLREEDVNSFEGGIVWSHTAVVERKSVHSFLRHILLCEDCGEFACAVVAEVKEDDCVTFLDFSDSLPVSSSDNRRFDELVCNPFSIRCFDRLGCAGGLDSFTCYEHVIRCFYAVPPLVAVHCIKPSAYGSYLTGTLCHFCFEGFYKAFSALRIAVAAIHKAMYENVAQAIFLGNIEELIYVLK